MSGEDATGSRLGSLASIARGASLYTVGKIVSDAGEFLLHLLVSRLLGAGPYGLFAYGKTLAFTALLLTNLGSDKSIVRYLPQYEADPSKRRFLLGLAWITSTAGALAVAGVMFVFASQISALTLAEPEFVGVLRLFAVILFLDTLANLVYATFRALEIIEYEVLTRRILKPLLRVIAVGIALAAGATVYGVVVAMLVAGLVTLSIAGYLFVTRTAIRPTLRSPHATRRTVREYYDYSLPLTAKEVGTLMQGRLDVLMVGFFLTSTAVGIYNVSVLVAGALYVPLLAANQLFAPVASRLYSNGDREELAAVYAAVTRWILSVSLALAVVLVVLRREVLSLFGPEFTAGTTVLTLFVLAQLWNAATGPSGDLLMMTDHQYAVMVNEWTFGVANVVLNYVLILRYGIVGAALATAGVLAARNLVKLAEVWRFERMQPYSWRLYKPTVAAVVAGLGTWTVRLATEPITGLVAGVTVGLTLYAATLYRLGIEPVDRRLYALIVDGRR